MVGKAFEELKSRGWFREFWVVPPFFLFSSPSGIAKHDRCCINSRIPQANSHAALNFANAKTWSHCIIHIWNFCLLGYCTGSSKWALPPKNNFLKVINRSLISFVNTFQRVTDYLLQPLLKLFEPFRTTFGPLLLKGYIFYKGGWHKDPMIRVADRLESGFSIITATDACLLMVTVSSRAITSLDSSLSPCTQQ